MAFRTSANKDLKTHVNNSDHDDLMTAVENTPDETTWFPKITRLQLLALYFGVLLYGLRGSNALIFGYTVNLLGGVVPIECTIWSLILAQLVLQDMRQQLRMTRFSF